MASKAILALLPIFLLLTPTKVSSYEYELKTTVHYVPPLKAPTTPPPPVVTVPAPPTPAVKPPTPPPPAVTVPTPPPTVEPPSPTPPVKVPPPQPPAVKPTPPVKVSPPQPPTVKPPSPTPPVKVPPPQPPVVKPPVYPSPPPPIVKSRKDCIPLCGYRCKLHSRKNLCMRACTACCERCKCVPPGTYGNREKCGKCYTDMVTHGNKPKCP